MLICHTAIGPLRVSSRLDVPDGRHAANVVVGLEVLIFGDGWRDTSVVPTEALRLFSFWERRPSIFFPSYILS